MSSLKKASNPHLTLVKKEDAKETLRTTIEVVSYEKLSLAQISVLNSYLSISDSIGNCVGALVGLEDWDLRPLVIENNKLTVTRFTKPEGDNSDYKKFMAFGKTLQISSKLTNVTGFGSTTDQLWIKRIFYQSTMKDKLSNLTELPFAEKKQYCLALAQLVSSLHQKKIIHGNISLSNISWVGSQPNLLDFGFAAISGNQTFYENLPPEVAAGYAPTFASDIYSLGKVFAELIASIKSLPLASLIEEMTSIDPENRPSLDKVIDFFEDKKEPEEPIEEKFNIDLLNPVRLNTKEKEVLIKPPSIDSSVAPGNMQGKNIPWFSSLLLIGVLVIFYFYYDKFAAKEEYNNSIYDQSSYLQLWQTDQPSMMQVVARAAIERNEKIAQSIIVKEVLTSENTGINKQINGALIRTAFDPRWEASLTETDRKIILILATAGIFSNDMPVMPSLSTASPIVLLSLMGTLQTDTPVKDFVGLSVEKLYRLPAPYDAVFKEYGKFKVAQLDDPSLRALAHISLGDSNERMLNIFYQPAQKEVELFRMTRVLLLLVPNMKELDSQIYGFLLTRSKVFAQAYRWFDEESFSDWNVIDRGDKIAIVSGIFPAKQLPFEKYADLLKHPNPKVSKEAAQIINSKFYGGKKTELLNYLASENNHFSRYQTISILASLTLEGKDASDFYTKWFQSKPNVASVLDFLILRSDAKANDMFNLSAAQYLTDKEWQVSHEKLKKLVLHPEALARALAYSKLDKSKPEDLTLLNSMSIAEPNPRLREQIQKIIGN